MIVVSLFVFRLPSMSDGKNTTSNRSRGSQEHWQDNSWDQWCHGGWHGNWWQEGWQDNSWDQRPARDWSDWTPVFANAAVTGVGNAAAVAGVGNAAAVAEPQLLQEAEPAKRGGKSHEVSFWKAWSHIARWREQEVDALKEGKAKVFHRRQSEWAMTIMFCHWRISTAESRTGVAVIYCECCEMWLNGPTQYAHHKLGNKHRRNNRIRWATPSIWPLPVYRRPETSSTASTIGNETSSSASWVDDETWSTTSEIGWSTTSEIGSETYFDRFLFLTQGPFNL